MRKFLKDNHTDGLSSCQLIWVYQSLVDQAKVKYK